MRHVEERGEAELCRAAELADVHALMVELCGRRGREGGNTVRPSLESNSSRRGGESGGHGSSNSRPVIECRYCKRVGHTISECPHTGCRNYKQAHSPKRQTITRPKHVAATNVTAPVESLFEPFTFPGVTSLGDSKVSITILRDAAYAQTIFLSSVFQNIAENYTEENVIVSGQSSSYSYTLAEIYLDCPLLTGPVRVAVSESLPVREVHLLLGNDLAGSSVLPPVDTVESPLEDSSTSSVDETTPHLFPVCVVTRSQTKLTPSNSYFPSLTPSTFVPEDFINTLSKKELITAQQSDPSLAKLVHIADDKTEKNTLSNYYYQDGIFMRANRPPHHSDKDAWSETHQVVVPQSVRKSIMKLAHDGYAGHLGVRQTYLKVLEHFYRPGMKKDVSNFVRTCHICLIVGKPNKPIPVAPH